MCVEIPIAKYKQYDEVVTTIMTNVLVEHSRCGKFLIYRFKPVDGMNKLYFNVTAVAADLRKENIYLSMPLLSYIKFRIKLGKKRRNLKWFGPIQRKKLSNEYKTSVRTIMEFICNSLKIDEALYDEINNEYYGWTKE